MHAIITHTLCPCESLNLESWHPYGRTGGALADPSQVHSEGQFRYSCASSSSHGLSCFYTQEIDDPVLMFSVQLTLKTHGLSKLEQCHSAYFLIPFFFFKSLPFLNIISKFEFCKNVVMSSLWEHVILNECTFFLNSLYNTNNFDTFSLYWERMEILLMQSSLTMDVYVQLLNAIMKGLK